MTLFLALLSSRAPLLLARGGGDVLLPKKQRLNMSLSYRLGEIEGAIPYEDVNPKWAKTSREKWLRALLQHGKNGTKLAELAIELLDAFTSACKEFLWWK